MKLRFLSVTFVTLVLTILTIFYVNQTSKHSLTQAYVHTTYTVQQALWNKVRERALAQLALIAESLQEDEGLINALEANDVERVRQEVDAEYNRFAISGDVSQLAIIKDNNEVLYSAPRDVDDVAQLVDFDIGSVRDAQAYRLFRAPDGALSLNHIEPLTKNGKVVGRMLATRDLASLIKEFGYLQRMPIAVISESGEQEIGEQSEAVVRRLVSSLPSNPKFPHYTEIMIGKELHGATFQPLADNPATYIVSLRDLSDRDTEQRRANSLAAAAIVAVLLLSTLVMYRFVILETDRLGKASQKQLEELNKVYKELQEAEKIKTHFLSNISHEIRTPMNGITGMVDLLNDTPLNNEQEDYLKIIRSSIRSLTQVIDDVLDFSKIEAGKMRISPQRFNFREWLNHNVTPLEKRAEEKGLMFSTFVENDVPEELFADTFRLAQVLGNIIGNAVKYTETGGSIDTRVSVESRSGNKAKLHFVIEDSGIGIPPDQQDEIFESFTQANNTANRMYGGSGLGLTICARVVPLMGGKLWVHSSPGAGSAFHFTIDVEVAEETEEVVHGEKINGTGGSAVHKDLGLFTAQEERRKAGDAPFSLAVLLVEDIPINQRVAVHILEKLGHKVDIASNGKEALVMLELKEYDLILMDVHMPQMDGLEATAEIRKKEKETGERSLIIALTARVLTGDKETCIEAGMDDYISKPITKEAVANKITKYFAHIQEQTKS